MDTQVNYRSKLLTHDQILYFHKKTLKVLSEIGVRVELEEIVDLLRENGCDIKDGNIVFFRPELVNRALETVPKSITIFNQQGEEAMVLTERNSFFGSGTDLTKTMDLNTGKMRETIYQDIINAAIVGDACQNLDFIGSFGLPSDIEKNLSYIENFKAGVQYSNKPIFFTAASKEDLTYIIKIAEVVVGGESNLQSKPFLIHYSEPTSPLTHSYGALQKLKLCAEKQVPINYTPSAMLGATCPVTFAGAVIQTLAEALSGIVIHQLITPGAPIISGIGAAAFDFRTASISYSAPEERLTNSAFSDIFHHYGIPMWSTVGSDACALDSQAGYEFGITIMRSFMDGANLIHDVGFMGQGLLSNPAAYVLCDEIISYCKLISKGFTMDENDVAFETIKKVGHGGHYLRERHTLKNYRNIVWRPMYSNRENPIQWRKEGEKSFKDIATARAKEILKTHSPQKLPENVLNAIDQLVKRAYSELKDMKFKS